MTNIKKRITNPMTVIAIFATLSETSAAVSLPFLDNKEREIYIWFLISFPFYLLLLFFATLNFNYRSLYAPSDFEKGKHFLKILDSTEHPDNNDPTISRKNSKRQTSLANRRSSSPPGPAQAPPAEIGLHSLFSTPHHIRVPELLKELYIIDTRWVNKKIEFGALLEKIQKPQETARVVLFLTNAKSEMVLKESAFKHSKQARKRDSIRFCAAYNLNSHEVTVIDQSSQPQHGDQQ
ncbi:hypothetical protein [Pseudomonas sp. PD9R]|uniref:hypothetical protein n=1 Tax=Pseudomonas sp. PD9R TaxID=2853534 RepID=UPI001C47B70D|nr:hypothetical protein [Pseudomonas sp. PD9R]MBV6825150.1 hypothetical protein [Pseudomonas sp. PD9R]